LVDTAALLAALQQRRLRAALDVTDPEPLPHGHPLWQAPNLLITPHVAGAVVSWRLRAYRFASDQVRRYAAATPLQNLVSNQVKNQHLGTTAKELSENETSTGGFL